MSLTSQQEETLAHFQGITGMEDLDRSRQILSRFHWNLQEAVEQFLANPSLTGTSTPSASSSSPRPSQTQRNTTVTPSNTRTTQQIQPNPLQQIAKKGWRFFFGMLAYLTSFLPLPISNYLANLANSPPALLNPSSPPDPAGAASRFLLNFEQKYGRNHPDFFQGTYNQALDNAKRDLRYLLAIIQSDLHDDTDQFNRNTLCSERLCSYLVENNVLVWAGNVRESEGYQVGNLLQASKFPFCALIAPQGSMMKVFDRIEGIQTSEELVSRLQRKIGVLQGQLEQVRREREEREVNRRIREEQDAAYQASLLADQEKERRLQEVREAEERALREEEEARRRQKEEEELQEQIKQTKVQKRARQVEQAKLTWEGIGEPETGAKLSIKLPGGARIVRKFKEDDTIATVVSFVLTQDLEGLDEGDEILLVSSFPRKEFTDGSITLKEAGLVPNGVLLVEGHDE